MSRVALSLALVLGPAVGCAVSASVSTGSGNMSSGAGLEGKPARPVEATQPTAPSSNAAEGAPPAAGAGGAAAAAKAGGGCEPALAEASTALFGTRILVRLPKGVEVAEENPFYAQAVAPDQVTPCGQKVSYAALGFFEYPNAATTAVRDQVLELRGIPRASVTWEDEGTRGRTYTGAYSAPADEATGAPAVRGWFVLRDSNDKYGYFALYESDPAHWDALKEVFVASGRSLLIKPRPQRSPAEGQIAGPQAEASSSPGGLTAEPAGAKAGAKPVKAN